MYRFPRGGRGIGGRKVFFGDSPTHRGAILRGEETFTEVYWRIDVRHQAGWTGGGPAKSSRAKGWYHLAGGKP